MRCAVIAGHRDEFPVRLMYRVLEVSVAGFYSVPAADRELARCSTTC